MHVGESDEHIVALARQAGAFDIWADHHSGRIDEHHDGNVEAVAELSEAAEFVRAGAVDRAAEVLVIVCDQPDGAPFDADQRGDDADAELGAQFQHRSGVGELLNHLADVEGALAVFRDRVAEQPLVDAFPIGDRALEVGEILLGGGDRFVLVIDEDVDTAGGAEVGHWADLFGGEESEPAAFDGGGAAHADVGVAGGDDAVGDAEDRGVAGEGAPGGDADHRHGAADPRHHVVGRHPLTGGGDIGEVGIAGASAGALGPDDQRRGLLFGELDDSVGLLVPHHPLRAGPNGFVVHGDQRGRAIFGEEVAVDRADTGDHPVGGRAAAHFFVGQDSVARGQDELAELDPRAGIDQIDQAFALRALALRMALRNPLAALLVCARGERVEQFLQVGADVIEIDLLFALLNRAAHIGFFDKGERVAFVDDVALRDGELPEVAGDVGLDDVLHLHRVHHEQLLAFAHGVALGGENLDDRALQRGAHGGGVGRSDDLRYGVRAGSGGGYGAAVAGARALAEVVQSRERIAGIELRAGQAGGCLLRLPICARRRCGRGGQLGAMVVYPAGIDVSVCEVVVRERAIEETEVGLDAVDAEFSQRATRARQRVGEAAGRRVGDQFRQQRVEVGV